MDGHQEKERGNRLFGERKYHDALRAYTDAIDKNSQSAVYFTNRALCHLVLEQWTQVVEDCQRALQLDHTLVKGHFYLGQAQCQLMLFDEAVESLMTAHTLAKDQKKNFGDKIASCLRLAKRKRWSVQEDERLKQQSSLQQLLSKLLLEHRDSQIAQLPSSDQSTMQSEYEQHLSQLSCVFEEADSNRKMREVPDYLCGKISFELMKDPVITPSGITYDRTDIEEHLHRVGHFDPVTRQKLTQDQLIPNLAMKEVVDSFTSANTWVDQY